LPRAEQFAYPNLLRLHAWIRLMISSIEKEIVSMIVAIAVAPA
jgi:hypothetical protein